jgi:hypothetical protein
VRVGRLDSPVSVRRELARLYTELRNGRVDPKVANSGGFLLGQITKALELEMIDERLSTLESQVASKKS